MTQTAFYTRQKINKGLNMRKIQWFIALFAIWLGLTNSFEVQELILGLLVSLGIVLFGLPNSTGNKNICFLRFFAYLPLFFKNLCLSNIDVARRVLDPKLPIKPGFVTIKTKLKEPYQRLILANSITLTPGTVTLDIDGEDMLIHWLDVKGENMEENGEAIKAGMEEMIFKNL